MAKGKKGPSVHVVPSKTQPGKFVAKEARTSSPRTMSQHVIHSPKGWVVRKSDSGRAARVFDSKDEAVGYARDVAKTERSELYVHRKDGTIMEKDSYRRG